MTKQQERYIIENFGSMSVESLRKMFNKKFGTDFKTTAFHYHTNRLGLKKHIEHQYTALEDEFLRVSSSLMTREELTNAFNETFGTKIKVNTITMRCCKKGFLSQNDGKFKNGSVPWEKTAGGRDEYLKTLKGGNSTSFRKGNVPMNVKPIGSIRKATDQNEEMIKTKYGWRTKRQAEYEKYYGKLPKGIRVVCVDGNKDNVSIENLRAIDNYTMTVLMSNGWLDKGAEIFDTAVQYAKLKQALGKNGVL